MPYIRIDSERCKGCELCVTMCPRQCIEIGKKINGQGYYFANFVKPDACTGCAICGETCPDVAIEVWR
ncbi:MAG: ferredoxin family protein [Deltaproteobacteria bacterium]|nr:MAG: ferredoxin family protein [Deltaproteobacteria bacterium]